MILCFRFAFALSALGETPRSSDCALAVWSNVVDALSADGAFSSDENPRFRAIWMLDPFALAAAPAVALAPAKVGQTLWVLLRRLGACTVRTCRGRDSEGFRPFGVDATSTRDGSAFLARNGAAEARCGSRSNRACVDLVSDDCASGFDAVASLGRRRTSTMNEGTARLTVFLDAACRSVDLSRRRRTCGASGFSS